jgi:signal transduction histidine kinase
MKQYRKFTEAYQDLLNQPLDVDIHEGIDSTLLILQHRLKATSSRPEVQIIREYGELPRVECYAGQLNQVFMNILSNAIDALEEASPSAYDALEEEAQDSECSLLMIRITTQC